MDGAAPTTIIGIVGNVLFLIVQLVTYFKSKQNVKDAGSDIVKGTAAQTTVDECLKIATEARDEAKRANEILIANGMLPPKPEDRAPK